eukprot:EG_transcript_11391
MAPALPVVVAPALPSDPRSRPTAVTALAALQHQHRQALAGARGCGPCGAPLLAPRPPAEAPAPGVLDHYLPLAPTFRRGSQDQCPSPDTVRRPSATAPAPSCCPGDAPCGPPSPSSPSVVDPGSAVLLRDVRYVHDPYSFGGPQLEVRADPAPEAPAAPQPSPAPGPEVPVGILAAPQQSFIAADVMVGQHSPSHRVLERLARHWLRRAAPPAAAEPWASP